MKCVVFASYFTSKPDPQRHAHWENDYSELLPLINSVVNNGIKIKIFHDCFDDVPYIELCEWIKVAPNQHYVPTVSRWFYYYSYLRSTSEPIDALFMVDSTDVVMLKNPFEHINLKTLYCGDEYNNTVTHPYIVAKTRFFHIDDYEQLMEENYNQTLLNCGILGGSTKLCIKFLKQLTTLHSKHSKDITVSLDMPIYNYTLLKYFKNRINHGMHVNTRFKCYEQNDISWWQHK